jgi:hypothetical protein
LGGRAGEDWLPGRVPLMQPRFQLGQAGEQRQQPLRRPRLRVLQSM